MKQMNEAQTLKTLQLFYAGALVDAVRQYHKHGVLEAVTEGKRLEQEQAAPAQLARLGIDKPEAIFTTFTALFGCADWKVRTEENGVRAETKTCLACGIAKKLGSPAPCTISCINPLGAQAAALNPTHRLTVERTLWEGESCIFRMVPTGSEPGGDPA